MQTMQQKRAKYALKKVNEAIDKKVNQKEYKAYAANLPAMIHTNGLGQAAAFFKSKGGTHEELYQLLSDWLCNNEEVTKEKGLAQPYSDYDNLLDGITKKDMHTYRVAQAEAQMLMDWVKKFAKAFMTDEDDAKNKEGEK
jgi:CRISPR-associated protein Cmr5